LSREQLLQKTIQQLEQLDEKSLHSIKDFVDYVASKSEDRELTWGIMKLAEQSQSFDFLNDEPDDLYKLEDLKVRFR